MAGRPRKFDTDEAIESAMHLFWRKGYEGTSIADLTRAMGINPPSLYAAFGSKQDLFFEAVSRYAAGPATYAVRAMAAPTAREVAELLLYGAVDLYCGKGHPGGCLGVTGALVSGDEAEPVRRELAEGRKSREKALTDRLKRAKAQGDLPADTDPTALADFLWSVVYGMGVQSTQGYSRRKLEAVVRMALAAWPAGTTYLGG